MALHAASPQADTSDAKRHDETTDKGDKSHRWAVKFACEAKAADVALVFFTWCLVIATLWLGWATIGLWKTTDQSIRLASSEYTSTHRPRISVRRVRVNTLEVGKPFAISYRVINSGETNANILQLNGTIMFVNGELPPVPEYDPEKTARMAPAPGEGLASGQWIENITSTGWDMNQNTMDMLSATGVFLVGFVRYSDESGTVREMAFGRHHNRGRFTRMKDEEYEYAD